MATMAAAAHDREDTRGIWKVIGASAVGTMIEWYDFYIFGTLATVIAPLFYPRATTPLALIAYLSTFAVGFVVRPFGALFFGRIGDLVGRKYAFLVTLLIMGGATALIGLLPTYETIGILAPILLLVIRILQGLALGGEYGGAAVYVAEHVPGSTSAASTPASSRSPRRSACSSRWSSSCSCRASMAPEAFNDLGLAHTVPAVDLPGRHVALHPPAHERVADVHAPEGDGQDLDAAAHRSFGNRANLQASC